MDGKEDMCVCMLLRVGLDGSWWKAHELPQGARSNRDLVTRAVNLGPFRETTRIFC